MGRPGRMVKSHGRGANTGVGTGSQGDPGRAAWLGRQHELWTRNKEGTGKAQGQGREAPWAKGGTRLRHEALNVA